MEKKFKQIKEIVKRESSSADHDIEHTLRVYELCLKMGRKKKSVDLEVLKAAALLHDIARKKEDNDKTNKIDHAELGAKMARPILKKLEFKEEQIIKIQDCIRSHRYRNNHEPKSIEAKILFDCDKLDSLGAIGIARGFVWIGRNNAKIWSDVKIKEYTAKNLQGQKTGRIIDKSQHSPKAELETKLKFLPQKMFTKKAKKIAKARMKYLKNFIKRLEKEVKGIA